MEKTILIIKNEFNLFLEILFPSKCVGCNIHGQILCKNCINNLRQAERPTESEIFAVYDYRDPIIKKAIWKLKYYHSSQLGQKLGELLYEAFIEDITEIKMFTKGSPIYVIPVPISHDRKKNRGYNQAEIIARSFVRGCTATYSRGWTAYVAVQPLLLKTNIIYKNKNTIPQARLTNRNRRLQNIKNAFSIKNKEQIKDKIIIVIDDVTTTGGTINEIIKLLKKSGAKKVIGFAVAH